MTKKIIRDERWDRYAAAALGGIVVLPGPVHEAVAMATNYADALVRRRLELDEADREAEKKERQQRLEALQAKFPVGTKVREKDRPRTAFRPPVVEDHGLGSSDGLPDMVQIHDHEGCRFVAVDKLEIVS